MNRLQQRGMSLIELMIAAALSLVISYFIMNIMITSSRTSATSEGINQAQETGRLVMAWLNDEISIAGYKSDYKSTVIMPTVAERCSSNILPPNANAHCTFDTNSNDNGGDRLAIIRKTGGDNPSPKDLQTCNGETLPTSIKDSGEAVVDVYWVSPNTGNTDTSDDFQFRCVTYTENGAPIGTSQTIANGVISMQLLLGIDDGNGTGQMRQFVSADRVNDWNAVSAVRIALLTREFTENNTLSRAPRSYGLLDSTAKTFDDTIARYVQNGTIWFPNSKKM